MKSRKRKPLKKPKTKIPPDPIPDPNDVEDIELLSVVEEQEEMEMPSPPYMDYGELRDFDVGTVHLPENFQEALHCVVGKNLGVDNQWKKVPADPIISEVLKRDADSVFAPYKEAIKSYNLPDMYIGYDPFRSSPDDYLICVTPEGFESLESHLGNETLQSRKLAVKGVEARPWKSFGSERDIEVSKLFSTRYKMSLSLEMDACIRSNKPRDPLVHVEPDAMQLRPLSKEVFDLVEKTLFDVSVQAVPRSVTTHAQTYTAYRRNAGIQSESDDTLINDLKAVRQQTLSEIEKDEDPLSQAERLEGVGQGLQARADKIISFLETPEVVNVFKTTSDEDRVTSKETREEKPSGETETRFREVQEFVGDSALRAKKIASVSWHPNFAGIVAIAYVRQVPTDCDELPDPAEPDNILGTSETSVSYEDSDTESMILPPVEKQKPVMLTDEALGDAIVDAVEMKKVRRTSDLLDYRDRNPPPLPFLPLEVSMYETESFDYQDFPEEETMDWTKIIKKKVMVLDRMSQELQTDIHSEDEVEFMDTEEYKKLKQKADVVEKMKRKTEAGLVGDTQEVCEASNLWDELLREVNKHRRCQIKKKSRERSKDKISEHELCHLWTYYDKQSWPFGPFLWKQLRLVYSLTSYDEEEKYVEWTDIPPEVLPSNLEEVKQKHRQPANAAGRKLAASFRGVLGMNKKLASLNNAVREKQAEAGVKPSKRSPLRGKVIEEDPARDPALGVEHAVYLWSMTSNLKPVLVLDSPYQVNVVAFCPHDGNIIAAGLSNGMLAVWDITCKIEKVLTEDVTENLNRERKILERKFSWTKNMLSDRIVKPVVLSKRESSHMLAVVHLQWLHPLIKMNSAAQVTILDRNSKHLSYQLVSSSLYGKLKFWDLESNDEVKEELSACEKTLRLHAQKILGGNLTSLQKLNGVWTPFYSVNPLPTDSSTHPFQVSNEIRREFPTLMMSKFHLQQPKVTYKMKGVEVWGSKRPMFKVVKENISKSEFPRTIQFTSFDGIMCLTSWAPKPGARDLDNVVGLLWRQAHHDGVITSISSCQFYSKVTLTSGGHEWCMWHDDYQHGPILWKCYSEVIIPSVVWSPFRPGVFFVARQDGFVEIWDLLECNNACVDTIMVGKIPLTVLSCSPHVTPDRSYLAVGDLTGALRLFSVPEHHIEYTDEELTRFRELCDAQPVRKLANDEWNTKFRQSHPNMKPVFESIAQDLEERKASQRESEKQMRRNVHFKGAHRRAKNRGKLDPIEEKDRILRARQNKHYLEEAHHKKNIDKSAMELSRLPLIKQEKAAVQIQDSICAKFRRQEILLEEEMKRKFPLIKQAMEMFPGKCLDSNISTNSDDESVISVPTMPQPGVFQASQCSGGKQSDIPGKKDLAYLVSEEFTEAMLGKVKDFETELEETLPAWTDIQQEYDALRQWQLPSKVYLDVENWRRLRQQCELKDAQTSSSLSELSRSISWGLNEADQGSTPSLNIGPKYSRDKDNLSVLTFKQAKSASSLESKFSLPDGISSAIDSTVSVSKEVMPVISEENTPSVSNEVSVTSEEKPLIGVAKSVLLDALDEGDAISLQQEDTEGEA